MATLHDIHASLAQRLTEIVGPSVRVIAALDEDMARQRQITAPAVFLTYEGLSVTQTNNTRRMVMAAVRFAVIVVARQAAAQTRAEPATRTALDLLEVVAAGLTGFKPTSAAGTIKLLSADQPEYEPPICWLPTSWEVEAVLKDPTLTTT